MPIAPWVNPNVPDEDLIQMRAGFVHQFILDPPAVIRVESVGQENAEVEVSLRGNIMRQTWRVGHSTVVIEGIDPRLEALADQAPGPQFKESMLQYARLFPVPVVTATPRRVVDGVMWVQLSANQKMTTLVDHAPVNPMETTQ